MWEIENVRKENAAQDRRGACMKSDRDFCKIEMLCFTCTYVSQ